MKNLIKFLLIITFLPAITLAISGDCSWHGGINCSIGSDFDGSVICNDGWKDSSDKYTEAIECQNISTKNPYSGCYGYRKILDDLKCILESQYSWWENTYKEYGMINNEIAIMELAKCRSQINIAKPIIEEYEKCIKDIDDLYAKYYKKTCKSGEKELGNTGVCYENNHWCSLMYGENLKYNSNTDSCDCSDGYSLNSSKKQCEKIKTIITKRTKQGSLKLKSGRIITYSEYCQQKYKESNFIAYESNNKNGFICSCKDGYKLNKSTNRCNKI